MLAVLRKLTTLGFGVPVQEIFNFMKDDSNTRGNVIESMRRWSFTADELDVDTRSDMNVLKKIQQAASQRSFAEEINAAIGVGEGWGENVQLFLMQRLGDAHQHRGIMKYINVAELIKVLDNSTTRDFFLFTRALVDFYEHTDVATTCGDDEENMKILFEHLQTTKYGQITKDNNVRMLREQLEGILKRMPTRVE